MKNVPLPLISVGCGPSVHINKTETVIHDQLLEVVHCQGGVPFPAVSVNNHLGLDMFLDDSDDGGSICFLPGKISRYTSSLSLSAFSEINVILSWPYFAFVNFNNVLCPSDLHLLIVPLVNGLG
jgi:hypothetical protein